MSWQYNLAVSSSHRLGISKHQNQVLLLALQLLLLPPAGRPRHDALPEPMQAGRVLNSVNFMVPDSMTRHVYRHHNKR
jgi:hypothetical protein